MQEELTEIHAGLCSLPGSDELSSLSQRLQQWMRRSLDPASLSIAEREASYITLTHIQVLAQSALRLNDVVAQTHKHLQVEIASCNKAHEELTQQIDEDPYLPWLQWFDAHLTYPYPSRDECDHLVSLIPGQTATKLRTWLTNRRRRSGWTELYEKHAHKDKARLAQLFEQYDDAILRDMLAEDTRKAVERVKSISHSEKKRQVGDWVDQVLSSSSQRTPPLTTPSSSPSSSSPPSTPPQKQSVRAHPYRNDRTKAPSPKSKKSNARGASKPSLNADPRHVQGKKDVIKVEQEQTDVDVPVIQDFSL